jgi:hypothetical protein
MANVISGAVESQRVDNRSLFAPSPGRSFLDLPLELLLLVIEHLNEYVEGLREPAASMYTAGGCPDMRDKWALKRVSRYFYALEELHAPSHFFIRQYPEIRQDRIKQQRLLAAFGLSLSLTGLLPCFKCKRFRQQENFCLKDNPSPYFYDGREMTSCLECLVQDGHIQLSVFSGSSEMFIHKCARCKKLQHNTQTLQCLCCHHCKCGSTRALVHVRNSAHWDSLTKRRLYTFRENSPDSLGSLTVNSTRAQTPTHSWQLRRDISGTGWVRQFHYYDCGISQRAH